MIAKILSLMLAAAALAGAVIYAQNRAEKGKKPKPVFDTSKSGTPTPIEETPQEKPAEQQNTGEVNNPGQTAEKPPKKKKQKKIMPSSKAAFPD